MQTKQEKRNGAEARGNERGQRSAAEQLAELDKRLGKTQGAKRERRRLVRALTGKAA
jgi:hypothetical protein